MANCCTPILKVSQMVWIYLTKIEPVVILGITKCIIWWLWFLRIFALLDEFFLFFLDQKKIQLFTFVWLILNKRINTELELLEFIVQSLKTSKLILVLSYSSYYLYEISTFLINSIFIFIANNIKTFLKDLVRQLIMKLFSIRNTSIFTKALTNEDFWMF